jgi:hypothetical protein
VKQAKAWLPATSGRKAEELLALVQQRTTRSRVSLTHKPSERFSRGRVLEIVAQTRVPTDSTVQLLYRHAHQAEAWQEMPMTVAGLNLRAAIPGSFTETVYPIIYYFVIHSREAAAAMIPGLGEGLDHMPYYVSRPLV